MSEPDETGEGTKKTKVVRRKLTTEEIDRMLSIPEHRKPFPMVAESFLARIHDPAERARYMGWADVYYKSQEDIKREKQYVRKELDTLGYVEREVEVTDDERTMPATTDRHIHVSKLGAISIWLRTEVVKLYYKLYYQPKRVSNFMLYLMPVLTQR